MLLKNGFRGLEKKMVEQSSVCRTSDSGDRHGSLAVLDKGIYCY